MHVAQVGKCFYMLCVYKIARRRDSKSMIEREREREREREVTLPFRRLRWSVLILKRTHRKTTQTNKTNRFAKLV